MLLLAGKENKAGGNRMSFSFLFSLLPLTIIYFRPNIQLFNDEESTFAQLTAMRLTTSGFKRAKQRAYVSKLLASLL